MTSLSGDHSHLVADDLTVGYDGPPILRHFSRRFDRGRLHALIGPNGSGKSTLLRALARLLRPEDGAVLLDDRPLPAWRPRTLARELSVLPQRVDAPGALTVRELVAFGRYPHRGIFGGENGTDHEAVRRALEYVGIQDLQERTLGELSGGQRQLAWIAMALAQEARTLLLDEPTAALDLNHQLEVLDLLARLRDGGTYTVVVVLHDVNLAARYADRILALRDGQVVADGSPRDVMRAEILAAVYGIDAEIVHDPRGGAPQCVAYRAVDGGH